MPNPVVHWEVGAKDGQKLSSFFRDLFDWHVEEIQGKTPYFMFDTHGESGINGGIAPVEEHPGVIFYVEVDDPDKYLQKAEGLGGKTIMPTTEMPMVTVALFADPEGHAVGLVKAQPQDG